MPSGKNWVNFIYINLAFAIYIFSTFYLNQLAQIKANWPLYRCNPMYMMLAPDIESNFVYCIQNMQTNFMGNLLQPLTFITSQASGMLAGFTNDINMVRGMFNKIRTLFSSIIQSVFGVFLNIIIEFQKITISIKDLIGKTIGIMVTLMYTIDGSIMTMQSAWNGPPGQMVQALGKCFHPITKLTLKNGRVLPIKDVNLGDVLMDGSIVETTMRIDNKREAVPMYKIKNRNDYIYVTGSHLVFDETQNKFIEVKDYSKAVLTDIKPEWLCCLITSKHRIMIGDEIFWDWEDHFIKQNSVFIQRLL
jgi:hypothetical protein